MSAPYRSLEEDHISVDSAGSQQSGADKSPGAPPADNTNPRVEVVGMSEFPPREGSTFPRRGSRFSWKYIISLLVIIFLVLLVVVLVVELAGRGSSDGDFPWADIRLPKEVVPSQYQIFLNPDLDAGKVDGSVNITIVAVERTDFILIHAVDMVLNKTVLIKNGTDEKIEVKPPRISEDLEMAYLGLGRSLDRGGVYNLTIQFSYNLTGHLNGFYVSSYMEGNNRKVIGSTQMEPLSARKAFPCFDEPGLRANFSLQLVHKQSHNVTLFNMPKKHTSTYPGDDTLRLETFQSTVSMSTYLVAFVICEFTHIGTTTVNGTQVAVHSRGSQQDQMGLALEVLNETIPFYESYFDIAYPLPKQDMAAIPNFEAGAMENWGLILYRETDLLYKENVTKSSQQQRIVIVITHELAHQWFGNLVTMKWWNDLWLNEGFATYMEHVGCDNYMPDWKIMDQFFYGTTKEAMAYDSLPYSHPVSVEVRDADDIHARFDSISYAKGASIIRMLSNHLGEDTFRKGLHKYLEDHAYGNTETADLWNALSAVDKSTNVTELMDYWTLQMGFPLVTMSREGTKVRVTQQQFLLDPDSKPSDTYKSDFNYRWMIPLKYSYNDGSLKYGGKMIEAGPDFAEITVPEATTWIKGNREQFGFFRMTYDRQNWERLADVLLTDHEQLGAVDRAGVVDDAFHVFRANIIDMDIPFSMIDYLKREQEYVPFVTALNNLAYIRDMLQFRPSYGNFTAYISNVLRDALNYLDFEDTGDHLEKMLRADLVRFLYKIGDKRVLQWIQNNSGNNASTVGVNLFPIMKCGRVMLGQKDVWEQVWDEYKVNTIASENRVLLTALSCTRDPQLLTRFLYEALKDGPVRSQDSAYVIELVIKNPAGSHLALNFVLENWDKLAERLGGGVFTMTRLLSGLTSWIATEVLGTQVEEFLNNKYSDATAGQKAPLLQAFETMNVNYQFLTRNEDKMAVWFAEQLSKV